MSPDPTHLSRLLSGSMRPSDKRQRLMAPPLVADLVSRRDMVPSDAATAPGSRHGLSGLAHLGERVRQSAADFASNLSDHPADFLLNNAPITSDVMSAVDGAGATVKAIRSALTGDWKGAGGNAAMAGLSLAGALPHIPRMTGKASKATKAPSPLSDPKFSQYTDDDWDSLRDRLEDLTTPLDDSQRSFGLSRAGYEAQDAVTDFVGFAQGNAHLPVDRIVREWKRQTNARPAGAKRLQQAVRDFFDFPLTP